MTVSVNNSRGRSHSREEMSHLFRVGQMVRMKSRFGASPKTAEFYRVTGTLPARDNSPQYRIRNDDERHERVVTEDSIEPVAAPEVVDGGTTLVERTFSDGQGPEAQQRGAAQAEAGEGTFRKLGDDSI
jgi:hypothetical protein